MIPDKKQLESSFKYMKNRDQETTFVHYTANKIAICFLSLWGEFYLSGLDRQAKKICGSNMDYKARAA